MANRRETRDLAPTTFLRSLREREQQNKFADLVRGIQLRFPSSGEVIGVWARTVEQDENAPVLEGDVYKGKLRVSASSTVDGGDFLSVFNESGTQGMAFYERGRHMEVFNIVGKDHMIPLRMGRFATNEGRFELAIETASKIDAALIAQASRKS